MKYFSMFSGIGGFELGIQQAYDNRELLQSTTTEILPNDSTNLEGRQTRPTCIGYSEIDKYAIQIYERHFKFRECENCRLARERERDSSTQERQETLNSERTRLSQANGNNDNPNISPPTENNCKCEHKNYGDATKINAEELPDFDLLVGGFPCQAFSIAGKRLGLEDSRGTLFYDIARIAKEKRPQHLLLENVKGLLSHDSGRTFKLIISTFAELGYNLEWQVLNSKNFGVPQNRERVFIIGHLGRCCGRQVFPLQSVRGEVDDIQPTAEGQQQGIRSNSTSPGRDFSNIENWRDAQGRPRVRRLTPTECERLQGYPDGWTKEGWDNSSLIKQVNDGSNPIKVTNECLVQISDSQRYKTLGNSVTVNVIEEIIKRLYELPHT